MRKALLIALALLSVAIATALGYYFWDALLAGMLGIAAGAKKLGTIRGLTLLLKKTPWMLLGGLKKLTLKILGGLLLLSARQRFRPVRKLLILIKVRARKMLRRLRFHWSDLSLLEKGATLVALLPLSLLVLAALIYMLVMPKPLKLLAARKLRDTSGATVITRILPRGARLRAAELHGLAKGLVKRRRPASADPPDSG
jgi:hypothetical protein